MKNEIQIFNYQDNQVRTIERDGEPWFVLKDVCDVLGLTDTNRTAERLDPDELTRTKLVSGGQGREMYIINESGLYNVILRSDKPEAKPFRKWVTSEVLPSIRKHGAYMTPETIEAALLSPDTIIKIATALKEEQEKRKALEIENETQRQLIADFEPVRQYVDAILSSDGTMATTQIAADYEISARMLNRILHEEGVQYNVNGQWILYRKYMGKGYTKSDTIHIRHADGRPDTRMHTKWTQKGRLMIHEILTRRGIRAVMDRDIA